MMHSRFPALLQVSLLTLTSFDTLPGTLINMDSTISPALRIVRPDQVVLTLFMLEILKKCDQMAVAIDHARF